MRRVTALCLLIATSVFGGAPAQPEAARDPIVQRLEDRLPDAMQTEQRRTQALRGLAFRRPVAHRIETRTQVLEALKRELAEEVPDALFRARGALLKALGCLPPEADLKRLFLNVVEEQVGGYYDWKGGRMVVSESAPILLLNIVLSHELTHALQDQHFDLSLLPDCRHNSDRELGLLSLLEGDATLVMCYRMFTFFPWLRGEGMIEAVQNLETQLQDPQFAREVVTQSMTGFGQLGRAPKYLRQRLLFPYLRGVAFVITGKQQGGWKQINQAYRRLPESSEQILHPEKYFVEYDAPLRLSFRDLSKTRALRPGWELLDHDVMGEFGVRVVLEKHVSAAAATQAAAGWDGDLVHLYRHSKSGQQVLVWLTTWDEEKDADEFKQAAARAFPGAGERLRIEARGREVLIIKGAERERAEHLSRAVWLTAEKAEIKLLRRQE